MKIFSGFSQLSELARLNLGEFLTELFRELFKF